MFPFLKIALRLEDMFILVIIGGVFIGFAYLVDRIREELRDGSFHATNYSPWQMPELTMFTAAIITGALSLTTNTGGTIDLQVHDTYLIVATGHVGGLLLAYFSFAGLVYFLARRLPLAKGLTIMHLLFTVGACLAFSFYHSALEEGHGFFRWSGADKLEFWTAVQSYREAMLLSALVFIIAQPLLLLNVFVGLARRRNF